MSEHSDADVGTSASLDNPLAPPRYRHRIILHDDSSSEYDSSMEPCPKRVARIPSDSSEDSDLFVRKPTAQIASESSDGLSDWETDCETVQGLNVQATDSDTSDGSCDKCAICLMSLKSQEVGTPESCDHVFCIECLLQWSKTMNTCPVDRQEYRRVFVRKNVTGKVYKKIDIEKPHVHDNSFEFVEDPIVCEICASGDREDRMLLCDGCNRGYHMECLQPALDHVPEGAWYCTMCSPRSFSDDELSNFSVPFSLNWELDSHGGNDRQARPRRNAPR